MDDSYITLQDAARLAGYRNDTTLRTAARTGRLRTVSFGPHARLTTRKWLVEYLASVRPGAYRRGQQKGRGPGAEEPECQS